MCGGKPPVPESVLTIPSNYKNVALFFMHFSLESFCEAKKLQRS